MLHHRLGIYLALILLLLAGLPSPTSAQQQDAAQGPAGGSHLVTLGGPVPASAARAMADVNLILDDGIVGGGTGWADTEGHDRQFLWFSRFTPGLADFPLVLQTISVIILDDMIPLGSPLELVVYFDSDGDGDPSNAVWRASYDVTVKATGWDEEWNVYDLPTPVVFREPGDVLIGVINRYADSGVATGTVPAATDAADDHGRSWIAIWSGDPPSPPVMPPTDRLELLHSGDWMIRASGRQVTFSHEVYMPVTMRRAN